MRLVMLIENTSASPKLLVEHGMSVYTELFGSHYLFDTGASQKLITNAKKMRLPLGKVEKAVISHNHSAHTGGIDALLNVNPEMLFYARASADCKIIKKSGMLTSPLGNLAYQVRRYKNNFVLFNRFHQLGKGFFLMTYEENSSEIQTAKKEYVQRADGTIMHDEYAHECFAVLFPDEDKSRGCVILSGCSHCGIVNIIKTVQKTWRDVPVLAIICGLHFMGTNTKKISCDTEYIERTAREIKSCNVGMIYACHCTGLKGYEELKRCLGDQLQYLQTGEELNF